MLFNCSTVLHLPCGDFNKDFFRVLSSEYTYVTGARAINDDDIPANVCNISILIQFDISTSEDLVLDVLKDFTDIDKEDISIEEYLHTYDIVENIQAYQIGLNNLKYWFEKRLNLKLSRCSCDFNNIYLYPKESGDCHSCLANTKIG